MPGRRGSVTSGSYSITMRLHTALDHSLIEYLEGLCARAYFVVYGTRPWIGHRLAQYFTSGWSRAVQSIWKETLASLLITAIALACMVEGLHPGPGYAACVFVVGGAALFSAIVPVPGNVGVGEAALAAGLVAVGVPSGPAFAIAVTQRIATSYLPPVYGAWALRWLRREDYVS